MKKPKLRTPDGKIEMRSIDEMLQAAASEDNMLNIPGKGKPLNLDDYFKPGDEFRVAGKILKENQVLPPHLQERKDAEELTAKAKLLLEEATEQIPQLRFELIQKFTLLLQIFPDQPACQQCLDIENWPEDFPAPTFQQISLKELFAHADQLTKDIERYNARIRNLIFRYTDTLKKAQENIASYHKRQMLSSTLTPHYNYLAPIDLQKEEQQIRSKFPQLPELPKDINARLKQWYRKTYPPSWKRFFSSNNLQPVF